MWPVLFYIYIYIYILILDISFFECRLIEVNFVNIFNSYSFSIVFTNASHMAKSAEYSSCVSVMC